MTASDDAREVLALIEHYRGSRTERLARTLLALTGEQAVEAAAWAIRDEACPNTPPCETCCEAQARAALAAALAAAEEAR